MFLLIVKKDVKILEHKANPIVENVIDMTVRK